MKLINLEIIVAATIAVVVLVELYVAFHFLTKFW